MPDTPKSESLENGQVHTQQPPCSQEITRIGCYLPKKDTIL